MTDPRLPEPTPGPIDNADLLGKCCGDWLSDHIYKRRILRLRPFGLRLRPFGSFLTCGLCDRCKGFEWDGKTKRPHPGRPLVEVAAEPDPQRIGTCCGCSYEAHAVYVPEEEDKPVTLICTSCNTCTGWEE